MKLIPTRLAFILIILMVIDCSFLQKTSGKKSPEYNPYLSIENAKLTIASNQPAWQFKILWKKNASGKLLIRDLNHNTVILNQDIREHKTYVIGSGLSPQDPKNNWMFQSERIEDVEMEVTFYDGNGKEFKSPFTATVSRETKQSLKLKFKSP
ncbi:MAG: hypothetical protein JJT78_13530 [Leptospira sp.]|nr:hypothetical protein [Leptospira sp.]